MAKALNIHIRKDRNLAYVLVRDESKKYRKLYLGPANSPETLLKYRTLSNLSHVGNSFVACPTPKLIGSESSTVSLTHSITISELFLRYIKSLESEPRPDKREISRAKRIRNELNHYYPNQIAHLFGAKKLREFRDKLQVAGYYENGKHHAYSRGYLNRMIKVIRASYAWGVSEELIDPNDHIALKYCKPLRKGKTTAPEITHKTRKKFLVTDEQIKVVIKYLQPIYRDAVCLLSLTGMRPGELCNLTWGEISEDEIEITRTTDGKQSKKKVKLWIYRPKDHKTAYKGNKRCIPFGLRAQKVLNKYKGKIGYIFNPKDVLVESYTLRSSQVMNRKKWEESLKRCRERLNPQTLSKAVHRAVKKAIEAGELKQAWTPYSLRAKGYSEVRKEFGAEAAQKFAGHSSLNMAKYYDLTDEQIAKELAALRG